jgi:hypothetical protein
MNRSFVIVASLALAGCSERPSTERAAAIKADPETKKLAGNFSKGMSKMRAKEEALKKDRPAIVREAVDAVRKAAAQEFGSDEAKQAEITADESGIKDFGGEKWKVTGLYVGPDGEGKKIKAPWTAEISLMFGSLQCRSIKLGDRESVE